MMTIFEFLKESTKNMQKMKLDSWEQWHNDCITEINIRSKWYSGKVDSINPGILVVLNLTKY